MSSLEKGSSRTRNTSSSEGSAGIGAQMRVIHTNNAGLTTKEHFDLAQFGPNRRCTTMDQACVWVCRFMQV